MARTNKPKKPNKPKAKSSRKTTATFPHLHGKVMAAFLHDPIWPEPWFKGSGEDAEEEYSTNVMGLFVCRNPDCRQDGWGSKMISILIRRYPDNGYNAVVYKQRCRYCKQLGALTLDEDSYVERVAYRLKKWAGVHVERPVYNEHRGPPHESDLCEGCKQGRCRRGASGAGKKFGSSSGW